MTLKAHHNPARREKMRAWLLARHPEWKGRLRIYEDCVTIRGLITTYLSLSPYICSAEYEACAYLHEIEDHIHYMKTGEYLGINGWEWRKKHGIEEEVSYDRPR